MSKKFASQLSHTIVGFCSICNNLFFFFFGQDMGGANEEEGKGFNIMKLNSKVICAYY